MQVARFSDTHKNLTLATDELRAVLRTAQSSSLSIPLIDSTDDTKQHICGYGVYIQNATDYRLFSSYVTKDAFRGSHSNVITGFESLGNIEGTMTLAGKKIGVKGTGVFEHAYLPQHSWIEFIWLDWIWFNFDELYGLLFETRGEGRQTGGIYLMKEKEFLPIRKLFIDHPQWAFSPVLQHQFPIAFSAEAHTDKGILFIEGDVVIFKGVQKIEYQARTVVCRNFFSQCQYLMAVKGACHL